MFSALTTEFQNTQKQKLLELNGETHRFVIIATDLKCLSIDRTSGEKITRWNI